uniref:Uncharacterized protein n=1 Tax=Cacopsylla melanoneura TaxID=428564 RepID=A0A8D9A6D7_9HEMI
MSNPSCKIQNCECQNVELSLDILYWLSHRNIDVRPLLMKQAYIKSKKAASSHHFGDGIGEFLQWDVPLVQSDVVSLAQSDNAVDAETFKRGTTNMKHEGSFCKKLKK